MKLFYVDTTLVEVPQWVTKTPRDPRGSEYLGILRAGAPVVLIDDPDKKHRSDDARMCLVLSQFGLGWVKAYTLTGLDVSLPQQRA